MDLAVYTQLLFLCVVNIIFTFSGIVLNTIVIISIWKSSQLRKKLCHFMIMVLSCSDLVTVITTHLVILICLISWLREDYNLLPTLMMHLGFVIVFHGFSFLVLLVMSIERFLGAYYPIFHRTSVTRRKLLTLLAILFIVYTTLNVIYINNIITTTLAVIISVTTVFFPLAYLNLKLFKISREVRRRNGTSLERRTTINLKSISTCLLVVVCLVVLSISSSVFIVFDINAENKEKTGVRLSTIWGSTAYTMNGTFNCLIFFWKNKIFRTEGIKLLKRLKDRLVGS